MFKPAYIPLRSNKARMVRYLLGHTHRRVLMPRLMIRSTSRPRFRFNLVWLPKIRMR